eukprot:gene2242-2955_t
MLRHLPDIPVSPEALSSLSRTNQEALQPLGDLRDGPRVPALNLSRVQMAAHWDTPDPIHRNVQERWESDDTLPKLNTQGIKSPAVRTAMDMRAQTHRESLGVLEVHTPRLGDPLPPRTPRTPGSAPTRDYAPKNSARDIVKMLVKRKIQRRPETVVQEDEAAEVKLRVWEQIPVADLDSEHSEQWDPYSPRWAPLIGSLCTLIDFSVEGAHLVSLACVAANSMVKHGRLQSRVQQLSNRVLPPEPQLVPERYAVELEKRWCTEHQRSDAFHVHTKERNKELAALMDLHEELDLGNLIRAKDPTIEEYKQHAADEERQFDKDGTLAAMGQHVKDGQLVLSVQFVNAHLNHARYIPEVLEQALATGLIFQDKLNAKTIFSQLPGSVRGASLSRLDLSNCRLTAKDIPSLVLLLQERGTGWEKTSRIAERHCLRSLNLHGNDFRDAGIKLLSEGLEKNEQVTSLNISNCAFGLEGFETLARVVAKNITLEQLECGGNSLGCHGLASIFREMVEHDNSTLTRLDVSNSTLVGSNNDGSAALGRVLGGFLGQNRVLTDINLRNTGITDEACQHLAEGLATTPCLTRLTLLHNPLTFHAACHVARALERNARLGTVGALPSSAIFFSVTWVDLALVEIWDCNMAEPLFRGDWRAPKEGAGGKKQRRILVAPDKPPPAAKFPSGMRTVKAGYYKLQLNNARDRMIMLEILHVMRLQGPSAIHKPTLNGKDVEINPICMWPMYMPVQGLMEFYFNPAFKTASEEVMKEAGLLRAEAFERIWTHMGWLLSYVHVLASFCTFTPIQVARIVETFEIKAQRVEAAAVLLHRAHPVADISRLELCMRADEWRDQMVPIAQSLQAIAVAVAPEAMSIAGMAMLCTSMPTNMCVHYDLNLEHHCDFHMCMKLKTAFRDQCKLTPSTAEAWKCWRNVVRTLNPKQIEQYSAMELSELDSLDLRREGALSLDFVTYRDPPMSAPFMSEVTFDVLKLILGLAEPLHPLDVEERVVATEKALKERPLEPQRRFLYFRGSRPHVDDTVEELASRSREEVPRARWKYWAMANCYEPFAAKFPWSRPDAAPARAERIWAQDDLDILPASHQ